MQTYTHQICTQKLYADYLCVCLCDTVPASGVLI